MTIRLLHSVVRRIISQSGTLWQFSVLFVLRIRLVLQCSSNFQRFSRGNIEGFNLICVDYGKVVINQKPKVVIIVSVNNSYFNVRTWTLQCTITHLVGLYPKVMPMTRDIDIVILSVRLSVCPSVRLSLHDTLVLYENGLTYRHSFSTVR